MASNNLRLLMMFRGCRLCGSGGGVKFPVAREEPQLEPVRHQIKEAVGIEIKVNDKMPPLVCEVCLDKVADFYDFKMMCQKTEETNRKNLNLSPIKRPQCEGECILGMTEKLLSDEDASTPGQSKNAKRTKSEPSTSNKKRKSSPDPQPSTSRGLRSRQVEEPQLTTRSRDRSKQANQKRAKSESTNSDDEFLVKKKDKNKRVAFERRKKSVSPPPAPKRARRGAEPPAQRASRKPPSPPKAAKSAPPPKSSVAAKLDKRAGLRDTAAAKLDNKRAGAGAGSSSRAAPAAAARSPAPKPPAPKSPPPKHKAGKAVAAAAASSASSCEYCGVSCRGGAALYAHKRECHLVGPTDARLACNACAVWFTSVGDTRKHHAWHRRDAEPYRCRRCRATYSLYRDYKEHERTPCKPKIKFLVAKHVVSRCRRARVVVRSSDRVLPLLRRVNETTYKALDEDHSFAPGVVYPLRRSFGPFANSRVPTLFTLVCNSIHGVSSLSALPKPSVSRLLPICLETINACLMVHVAGPASGCSSIDGADYSFASEASASPRAAFEDEDLDNLIDILDRDCGRDDHQKATDACDKAVPAVPEIVAGANEPEAKTKAEADAADGINCNTSGNEVENTNRSSINMSTSSIVLAEASTKAEETGRATDGINCSTNGDEAEHKTSSSFNVNTSSIVLAEASTKSEETGHATDEINCNTNGDEAEHKTSSSFNVNTSSIVLAEASTKSEETGHATDEITCNTNGDEAEHKTSSSFNVNTSSIVLAEASTKSEETGHATDGINCRTNGDEAENKTSSSFNISTSSIVLAEASTKSEETGHATDRINCNTNGDEAENKATDSIGCSQLQSLDRSGVVPRAGESAVDSIDGSIISVARPTLESSIAGESAVESIDGSNISVGRPTLESSIETTLEECENSNNLNLELEYERQRTASMHDEA